MNFRNVLVGIIAFLILPSVSLAGAVITYHGRILDASDKPVEASLVTFKIRIYSPNPGKCLLYEETRDLPMANSNGIFVVPIGDGNGRRTVGVDPGISIEEIFSNNPSLTLNRTGYPVFTCNSGGHSYTPQALDQRQLEVSFDDHSAAGEQILPIIDVGFVPLAVNSYDAQNVGGTPAGSVLRVSGGTATPLTPANFTELTKLLNGTTTQYAKAGQLNGVSVPSLSNGQVLGWTGGTWAPVAAVTSESDPSVKAFAKANLPACAANQFLKNDGSGNLVCVNESGGGGSGTVTSVTAGTGLVNSSSPGNPITTTGTLAVNVGTSANQIVQMGGDTKLPAVDGSKLTNVVASGLSSTASINTSGSITSPQMNTRNLYIENTTPNRVTITANSSFTDYSWILPNAQGTSGQVLGMSATAGQLEWKTLSASGVTSVTADAPVTIDSSTPSAPKVSLPKATAAVDGYLDNVDFAAFNAKQAAGDYLTTLQGDVASSNFTTGTVDVAVNKIKGVPVSAAPTLNGQVLRYASGSLVPSFVSMLDLRSNVTGSQALSASCGSNKTLTFNSATDSLLCENISITKSQISDLGTFGSLAAKSSVDLTADVNGVLPIANGGTGSNSVGQNLVFAGPSSGGAGAPSFRTIAAADLPASATYWSAATGGINYASGNIGIGTTTPNAALDVVGNMTASGNVGASVPAGSVVLMSSCAGGWTDVGTLAVGVPAAATCNGTSCHMCQAPAPSALIPSSSVLLMESCPKNWIYISTVSGAATAAGLNIPYSSCQSPASATSLPLGSKLIMASCPSQWSDLGQTTSGPLSANCGGSACRVCEVPGSTLAAQWQTSSGTLLLQPTSGNVGIGTSSPRAALDVNGAIVGKSAVSNASATIDFASGNMQYTTSDCGAFDLWNLKDGGTYMFAVQGTNATTCSFTAYLASGTSALTVHLPPDHGQTISGKHTIYSFAVIGSHVYVAWTPGM